MKVQKDGREQYVSPTVSLYEHVDVILASVFDNGDIGGRDIFESDKTYL